MDPIWVCKPFFSGEVDGRIGMDGYLRFFVGGLLL